MSAEEEDVTVTRSVHILPLEGSSECSLNTVITSYVEVKELRITDSHRASEFRVVFKHNSGAQEIFEAPDTGKTANTSFPCET